MHALSLAHHENNQTMVRLRSFVLFFLVIYIATIPLTVNLQMMRLAWAVAATLYVFFLSFSSPMLALLIFLFLKPIIEMSWDQKVVGSYSMLDFAGILPCLLALYFSGTGRIRHRWKRNDLWFLLLLFLAFGIIKIFISGNQDESFFYFEKSMRLTNAIAALILFQALIKNNDDYASLLFVMRTLAIIPIVFLFLQNIGFIDLRTQGSASGDIRILGFYHDVVNQRYYFSTGLLAAIGYLMYNKKFTILNLILACLFVYGLIMGYSKASTVFLITIPLVFLTFRKDFRAIFPALFLVIAVYFVFESSGYLDSIFRKEIAVGADDVEVGRALNGRVVVWQAFWRNFTSRSVWEHLLGSRAASSSGFSGGVHNDFLGNLGSYGVVGLSLYSLIVFAMTKRVFFDYQKWLGKVRLLDSAIFMARSFVLLWVVDSIGLHPSLYPTLMFLVFGIIGATESLLERQEYRKYFSMYNNENMISPPTKLKPSPMI